MQQWCGIMENSNIPRVQPWALAAQPPPPVFLQPRRPLQPQTLQPQTLQAHLQLLHPTLPSRPLPLQTSTTSMNILRIDCLKSQLQTSMETRLPAWAAQDTTPAVQQSTAVVTSPDVQTVAEKLLRQALTDAMSSVDQVIQQAAVDASKRLATDESRSHVNKMLLLFANNNRPKAAAVLDAAVHSPKMNQEVKSSLAQAVEEMLMESHAESVAVLSHFAFRESVKAVLRNEFFPRVVEMVENTFDQQLQELVRDASVVPSAQPPTRSMAHASAAEVAGEAMRLSLRLGGPPVAVPLLVPAGPAVPGPAVLGPPQRQVQRQVQRQAERTPLAAPVPRYACARSTATRPPPKFDSLPDEVLCRVLVHVDPVHLLQCSLVCRRWHKLCRDGQLWRCKRIRYDPASRASFLAAMGLAPELAMVDCEAMGAGSEAVGAATDEEPPSSCMIADHDLLRLLHAPCRVTGFRLPTALDNAPSSMVVSVLQHYKATLKELHLTAEPDHPGDLAQLLHTVDHMPNLRFLSLAGSFNVEYTFGPRKMGTAERKIQTLDLSRCTFISKGTVSSLLRAYSGNLESLALRPNASNVEVMCLSLCLKLWSLTVATHVLVDVEELPPNLGKLTLTAPSHCPATGFLRSYFSDLKRAEASKLSELVLVGVPSPAGIPYVVRAALSTVETLTLRRVVIRPYLQFMCDMPRLQNIVLDQVEGLTATHLRSLTRASNAIGRFSILQSLRCTEDTCWGPIYRFLKTSWPRAEVRVDVRCNCESK